MLFHVLPVYSIVILKASKIEQPGEEGLFKKKRGGGIYNRYTAIYGERHFLRFQDSDRKKLEVKKLAAIRAFLRYRALSYRLDKRLRRS